MTLIRSVFISSFERLVVEVLASMVLVFVMEIRLSSLVSLSALIMMRFSSMGFVLIVKRLILILVLRLSFILEVLLTSIIIKLWLILWFSLFRSLVLLGKLGRFLFLGNSSSNGLFFLIVIINVIIKIVDIFIIVIIF